MLSKMPFNKRLIFFQQLNFMAPLAGFILKRVGNTGRRENKCRKIFLQAYFKGKPTNAMVSVSKLVHGMYHSGRVWNSHLYSLSTSGLTPRNVTLSRRRIE
jgi:hypothetical protein